MNLRLATFGFDTCTSETCWTLQNALNTNYIVRKLAEEHEMGRLVLSLERKITPLENPARGVLVAKGKTRQISRTGASLLEDGQEFLLQLVRQPDRCLRLVRGRPLRSLLSVVVREVLVSCAAATGVVVLLVETGAVRRVGNHVLIFARRGSPSSVRDVASTSPASTVGTVTVTPLHPRTNNFPVTVFGWILVDVAGSTSAVGYFDGHDSVVRERGFDCCVWYPWGGGGVVVSAAVKREKRLPVGKRG